MWVLKNQSGTRTCEWKFSSQSKLAEFMGIHPRTLNKALKEGRNLSSFAGKLFLFTNFQNFQLMILLEIKNSLKREAQIVEFFGVSRQTVYSAFKLNHLKKVKKMAKYGL